MNPGNAAGPLVNMEGKVIGLTSAIKTRSGGFQGVGLAVSSKLARRWRATDQERRRAAAVHRREGRATSTMPAAKKLKVKPRAGVARERGRREIARREGQCRRQRRHRQGKRRRGPTAREMQRAILALPIGQEVDLIVVRNGNLFRTKVAVEEQAEAAQARRLRKSAATDVDYGSLGLTVTDLTADAAKRAGLPKEAKGVVVAE